MAFRQIRDLEKPHRHANLHTHTHIHILKTAMHLIYNSKAWDGGVSYVWLLRTEKGTGPEKLSVDFVCRKLKILAC